MLWFDYGAEFIPSASRGAPTLTMTKLEMTTLLRAMKAATRVWA